MRDAPVYKARGFVTPTPQCNRLSASLCPHQDSSFWAGPGSHSFISTMLMPPTAAETGQEERTRSRPASAHPGHPPSHLLVEAGRALPRQALPRGQLISLLSPGSGEAREACVSLRVSPGQCHIPSSAWEASHQPQTVSCTAPPSGGHRGPRHGQSGQARSQRPEGLFTRPQTRCAQTEPHGACAKPPPGRERGPVHHGRQPDGACGSKIAPLIPLSVPCLQKDPHAAAPEQRPAVGGGDPTSRADPFPPTHRLVHVVPEAHGVTEPSPFTSPEPPLLKPGLVPTISSPFQTRMIYGAKS